MFVIMCDTNWIIMNNYFISNTLQDKFFRGREMFIGLQRGPQLWKGYEPLNYRKGLEVLLEKQHKTSWKIHSRIYGLISVRNAKKNHIKGEIQKNRSIDSPESSCMYSWRKHWNKFLKLIVEKYVKKLLKKLWRSRVGVSFLLGLFLPWIHEAFLSIVLAEFRNSVEATIQMLISLYFLQGLLTEILPRISLRNF